MHNDAFCKRLKSLFYYEILKISHCVNCFEKIGQFDASLSETNLKRKKLFFYLSGTICDMLRNADEKCD